MTRTPDCHFAAEARHNGSKMWVFAPDFNQVAKYADEWIPINAGQDGAWWMAVNHVLLKEFHHEKSEPYFLDYTKRYTDAPFMVELREEGGQSKGRPTSPCEPSRRLYRARERQAVPDVGLRRKPAEDADGLGGMPLGEPREGQVEPETRRRRGRKRRRPVLTFLGDEAAEVRFDDFGESRTMARGVPVRRMQLADGTRATVATVYDLLMAQYGVSRGLPGAYPADYDDETAPYTPAWSEKYTGVCRPMLRPPGALRWAGFSVAFSLLLIGVACISYQIATGVGTWGRNTTVGWSFDITNSCSGSASGTPERLSPPSCFSSARSGGPQSTAPRRR